LFAVALAAVTVLLAGQARAQAEPPALDAHWQATYIWQHKPAFPASYSGERSLLPEAEKSYSFSATGYLGARLWEGGEFYANPEVIQGVPLSGLQGLGSLSNGENQKTSGPHPTLYLPRLFLRQTWPLGQTGSEQVESAQNQLAGPRPRDRIVLTAGKFSITDVFDQNTYSHDARTQFLTWASLAQGAFDYVADAQGYTIGAAVEVYRGDWALRAGRFAAPSESNGPNLTLALGQFHGDQLELEHRHAFGELPGAVRVLLWRNVENMGGFAEAIDLARAGGGTPDVARVRHRQSKSGYGLHFEQQLTQNVGAFIRYSASDGRSEAFSFEEVDSSAQLGAQFKGAPWNRQDDTFGLLRIANGLSPVHRDYLAKGGLGFFVGDGRLNYRREQVTEAYYSLAVVRGVWISADLQHIRDPAYNADRGPVKIYSVRFHAEY
jgi:carbohydrate-selective porin OprB